MPKARSLDTTIRAYMTPVPHSVTPQTTMAVAHELMRDKGIRHLPVLHGGKLQGVVSQRDLAIMETLPGVDPRDVPVQDAMTVDIYTTTPDTPLRLVAGDMAAQKIGSAVVVEGSAVVGVFTTVDALQALSHILGLGDRGDES